MVPHLIPQEHDWTCWASALAMMLQAYRIRIQPGSDHNCTPRDVAAALGPHYLDLFEHGLGISADEPTLRSLSDTWGFTYSLRQSNPDIQGWQQKLEAGPVVVLKRYIGGGPYHHAVVASHVDNGRLVVYDPAPPHVGTIHRDGRGFLGSFLGLIEGPGPYAWT